MNREQQRLKSPLFLSSDNPDEIGGRKSVAHILGQDRLVNLFSKSYTCKKEFGPILAADGKTYWIDVALKYKSDKIDKVLAGLEVDTYVYGTQKKKSPKHIKNRDIAIMEALDIPIIRIDVDALKEGRRKTPYYMNDLQLTMYVSNKQVQYWGNKEKYMQEVQRG